MPAAFDHLKLFDKAHKKDMAYKPFETADAARLKKRLPVALTILLKRDGFASYDKGLLWTCDPDDWNKSAKPWFPEKPAEVFMRTSFGQLFLWDGKYCWFAKTTEGQVNFSVVGMDWFLGRFISPNVVLKELGIKADTDRARKQAGELAADEVYAWQPALALGGSRADSGIERVNASAALNLLASLAPIEVQQV